MRDFKRLLASSNKRAGEELTCNEAHRRDARVTEIASYFKHHRNHPGERERGVVRYSVVGGLPVVILLGGSQ